MPQKFFITHSHKDNSFARRLCDDLQKQGLGGFFDIYSIHPGDNISAEIDEGLKACDVYVPILSFAALKSDWCKDEIHTANTLSKRPGRNGRPRIIPILVEDCHDEMPAFLQARLYINFAGRYDEALNELLTKGFGIALGQTPTLPSEDTARKKFPVPIPLAFTIVFVAVFVLLYYNISLIFEVAKTSPTAISPTKGTQNSAPMPTLGIGSSKISPIDGATMMYVPAGEFLMGSIDTDKDAVPTEKPQHNVYLDAFWMDKFEVTNGQYLKCVITGKCSKPSQLKSWSHVSYYDNKDFSDYPVIYVSWNNAQSYCQWADRRLATEAEWEKATRGIDRRIYPWGNDSPTKDKMNYSGSDRGDVTFVGSYVYGASPYGIMDLAGNVWEWVNDWYDPNYYSLLKSLNPTGTYSGSYRVLRGGSWSNDAKYARASFRHWAEPSASTYDVGFRCAQ